jgi:hypothetical protein
MSRTQWLQVDTTPGRVAATSTDRQARLRLAPPPTTSPTTPQAKSYLQLNVYDFNFLPRLALHVLSVLPIPPPQHAWGLGLANTKVTRPERSYFLSCAMFPSPSTCSGAWPGQFKGRQTCGVLLLLCVFFLFLTTMCVLSLTA